MTTPLQMLVLEDRADDAELIVNQLRTAGFAPSWQRVDTEDEYRAALDPSLDLVIADHALPRFNSLAALRLLQERGWDIPFIVVSGAIGEDTAVSVMKHGATDYLLKDRLARLGPAVAQALDQKKLRHQMERVDATARENEQRFRTVFERAPIGMAVVDTAGSFLETNRVMRDLLGATDEELQRLTVKDLFHPDDRGERMELLQALQGGTQMSLQTESRYRGKGGRVAWGRVTASAFLDAGGGARHILMIEDITARKQVETALAASRVELEEEAAIWGALAWVGEELISASDTHGLLDRLCAVTAEVLECDASHTLLWQSERNAFVARSAHGWTQAEWEAISVVELPRDTLHQLLGGFDQDDVVPLDRSRLDELRRILLGQHEDVIQALTIALRRGSEIIGIHVAGYRSRSTPYTAKQLRTAQGIAQLASLALENARLLEELERATRLKSEFVATISHEFRTPLNAIVGYTSLLTDGAFGDVPGEQADILARIETSSSALIDLVNTTLDLSRIEAGQMPVQLADVTLREVSEELDTEIAHLRKQSGLALNWELDPTPSPLHTDRTKLKVVLKNLITNAFKFTDHGNVTVTMHARDGGMDVAVADTGIGIAPDALQIIFEAFRQVDGSDTRRYGGAGLGLYIVRRLVDLLGGTIAVESEVGRGSTFRVWVPSRAA